ncbi:MAG: flagellar motor stator protein MotA [Nitrospiraceae bacterium]|nr:flagellar motor stator protein MotA [Nitrospiraceae bacterium]
MFAIVGIVVVLGSIISGYLLEHGNLSVLFQPAEVVIIFGAAIGSFLISSPGPVAKLVAGNIGKVFSGGGTTKAHYLEILALLSLIFSKIRKEGLISIESDIENPVASPMFSKFKSVVSNRHAVDFICDNLKVMITTNLSPHELDGIMEIDMDAQHSEEILPSQSINKIGDALPGLGIVAAVLGVVITMGKIDQPPAVLGHSIGAALVGTFLGVLMCYGFVGPMATNLEHKAREKEIYAMVIRTALVAFVGGAAPQMAVESGRRAIPGKARPSFAELEVALRKKP